MSATKHEEAPVIRGYAGAFHRSDEVVSAIDYEKLRLQLNEANAELKKCAEALKMFKNGHPMMLVKRDECLNSERIQRLLTEKEGE